MVRVIDLFCGIGGLTNGLQQAGLNVVAGIDLDSSCKYAYEKNNESQFINKSIENIDKKDLQNIYGDAKIRILVGCAPCQPFSNHQKMKKNRKSHKLWGLLYEFLRLVKEIEPEIVSMENVPSLIKEDVFIDFVNGLKETGYYVNYQVHDALDYGMAQRRKRLILLASKYNEIEFANDKEKNKTIRDVIGHLPPIKAGEASKNDRYHVSSNLSEINFRRIRSSRQGGTWMDWDESLLPDCFKKESGKSYKSVYGRMDFDSVSPTLTTQFYSYGTGRFGHPLQDRAISLREGALLQSFPMEYEFLPPSDKLRITTIARQIGNAVPPRIGVHIGKSIVEHIENYL